MQREGIFREMKLRGHYEKPSERKAREKAEAIRRARKLASTCPTSNSPSACLRRFAAYFESARVNASRSTVSHERSSGRIRQAHPTGLYRGMPTPKRSCTNRQNSFQTWPSTLTPAGSFV